MANNPVSKLFTQTDTKETIDKLEKAADKIRDLEHKIEKLTAGANSANKQASSDKQALDSKTKEFESLLDEKDQADEDCRSAINQTRTINKELEEVKRKNETLEKEAANAVDTISDLTNDNNEIQSKLNQLERSSTREKAEADAKGKSMEQKIRDLEIALEKNERARTSAQESMDAMANAESGVAQALSGKNEELRSTFTSLESDVKALTTKVGLLQVSVLQLRPEYLLLTLDQSELDKTKKTHEETNNALTELRYNYLTYQGNTEVKEKELVSKNDALVKENNHLVAGITFVLQKSGQNLMNLEEIDDDLRVILFRLVQNSSKYMLTEMGNGTTQLVVAPVAEIFADEFNVVPLEKNVQTLMSLVVQTLRNTGSVDDLAHIQQNYTRHEQGAQEPTWVLAAIACFLDKEIEIAGDDRDGIRFCMALSLVSQLDEMLYDRKLPTLGWNLVRFRSHVASFADKGYIAFVMTARYLESRQMHDILYDTPALQQRYGRGEVVRTLIEWCAIVKVDCTFLEALTDLSIFFLSADLKTWIGKFEEKSSGKKLTILWDRHPQSWFQDTLFVFLQDNNDHTTFRPSFTIRIEPWTHVHTIHFGRGSEGIKVNVEWLLYDWLAYFYKTELLQAEQETLAFERAVADREQAGNPQGASTTRIKREPEADIPMQLD